MPLLMLPIRCHIFADAAAIDATPAPPPRLPIRDADDDAVLMSYDEFSPPHYAYADEMSID